MIAVFTSHVLIMHTMALASTMVFTEPTYVKRNELLSTMPRLINTGLQIHYPDRPRIGAAIKLSRFIKNSRTRMQNDYGVKLATPFDVLLYDPADHDGMVAEDGFAFVWPMGEAFGGPVIMDHWIRKTATRGGVSVSDEERVYRDGLAAFLVIGFTRDFYKGRVDDELRLLIAAADYMLGMARGSDDVSETAHLWNVEDDRHPAAAVGFWYWHEVKAKIGIVQFRKVAGVLINSKAKFTAKAVNAKIKEISDVDSKFPVNAAKAKAGLRQLLKEVDGD